jgi:hypothetical protein
LRLGEGGAETLSNCFSHMRKEIQISFIKLIKERKKVA